MTKFFNNNGETLYLHRKEFVTPYSENKFKLRTCRRLCDYQYQNLCMYQKEILFILTMVKIERRWRRRLHFISDNLDVLLSFIIVWTFQ